MRFGNQREMSRGTFLSVLGGAIAGAGLLSLPAGAEASAQRGPRSITIVPLDNRPVNMYAPEMTAKVAGARPGLPPKFTAGEGVFPPDPVTRTVYSPGDADAIGK